MKLNTARGLTLTLLTLLLCGQHAQASNRWDVMNWCSAASRDDVARCEGFILAAIDSRTSDDYPGPKSCFLPSTRLPQVRQAVVAWLKLNKAAPEQSGLALVTRANV